MKIKLRVLALFAVVFLSGYKKDVNSKTIKPVSKKMVRTTLKGNRGIVYNSDGTPHLITWAEGGEDCARSFSYGAGRIKYIVRRNNKRTEEGEYTVVNGRITTLNWVTLDVFEQPGNHYSEKFLYNGKGLLEKHSFNDAHSTYAYDANDDLILVSHYDTQGKPTTTIAYKYSPVRDLFPAHGYFNTDGSGFFLPPFSRYLPASKKVTKVSTGIVTLKGAFNYELDADGYVLKGKWDAVSAGDPDTEWSNHFQ